MTAQKWVTLRGLLTFLRTQGVFVTPRQVDFAISAGHLPEPPRSTSGQRVWGPEESSLTLAFFSEKKTRKTTSQERRVPGVRS
jgi:hypothetical protein